MVLELASPAGLRLALIFFALLAVVLGGLVAALIRRRSRPAARRRGLPAGALLALAVLALVQRTSLDGFCRLELGERSVRLVHALPTSDVELALDELTAIQRVSGVRPYLARLELAAGARRYLSQSAAPERVEAVRAALEASRAALR